MTVNELEVALQSTLQSSGVAAMNAGYGCVSLAQDLRPQAAPVTALSASAAPWEDHSWSSQGWAPVMDQAVLSVRYPPTVKSSLSADAAEFVPQSAQQSGGGTKGGTTQKGWDGTAQKNWDGVYQ